MLRAQSFGILLAACGLVANSAAMSQAPKSFDAAAAFGALPSVEAMTLSPDGTSVAYLVPTQGQGSVAYTVSLAKGSVPKPALKSDGKPFRLQQCNWVSNSRLVCTVYGLLSDPELGIVGVTRTLAVNTDGSNLRTLGSRENRHTRGFTTSDGFIIDWLPDEDGAVLMCREFLPDAHIGTKIGSTKLGLGVDWINTETLADKHLEAPRPEAVEYITDGHGTVRIVGNRATRVNGMDTGDIDYFYEAPGSHDWKPLSTYNYDSENGFNPFAVDRDLNVVYGFKKKDGRQALYAVSLDGSLTEQLVYARPDVDVTGLMRLGRSGRVVGASYITDIPAAAYFDPTVQKVLTSLGKALPQQPLVEVIGSSADENRMLVFGGSDSDPGVYYIFDRKAHQLDTFVVARAQLEGITLAKVKPVTYPAEDGTLIPGYLTLPPGHEDAKGLPAIVLPHGGPSARDVWGFDWLSQFFASRGYAVLQPEFRGSSGYGDAWFRDNGFKSWRIAIGDVNAGGHWLVSQGADPSRLAIVGWSYGGYAALQSAVVEPTLFKAVVAIAPVTDLAALKADRLRWTDYARISAMIGDGPQMHEGSPIENVSKIKAPVLMFQGEMDHNVSIEQSRRMADRLKAAGGKVELVTWPGLDHYLEDSAARELMLRRSDEFLQQSFAAAGAH